MKQIWKVQLDVMDIQPVKLPKGSRILKVAEQNGNICMWAEVDPEAEIVSCEMEVYGTGHDIGESEDANRKYIGTALVDPFVWHVYGVLK